MFKEWGIFLTIGILGIAVCYFVHYGIKSNDICIYLALWSSYICVFFLPSMHDRYSYLPCMFSILWVAFNKKDWWIAMAVNIITFLSWTPYLSQKTIISFEHLSAINLILVLFMTYKLFTIHKSVPCMINAQETIE